MQSRGVGGGGRCHRSPTSAEVASTPRSQGGSRASRRAPVPTARQSPRFRRSTRVRPGECQKASEERDTPTSPLCCRSLGTAACGPTAHGTLLLVRLGSAEAHRGAARRGATPSPGKGKPPRDATVKWPPRVVGSLWLSLLSTRLARAASSLQPRDARGAGQRAAHLRSPRPPPFHSPKVSHKGRSPPPLAPPTSVPLAPGESQGAELTSARSAHPSCPRLLTEQSGHSSFLSVQPGLDLWVSGSSPRRDRPSGSYWKKQALAC